MIMVSTLPHYRLTDLQLDTDQSASVVVMTIPLVHAICIFLGFLAILMSITHLCFYTYQTSIPCSRLYGYPRVYHTKVLSGTKKEKCFFLWSKVFLDKVITIGRKSGFRTKMVEPIIRNWMVMESEIRRVNDNG